jgi:phospholipid-binding lipoprotein MlaA
VKQSNFKKAAVLSIVYTMVSFSVFAEEPPVRGPLEGTGIQPDVVSYPDYNDPLIRFNRAVFVFNDAAYIHALIPASRWYQDIFPTSVRSSISNFFNNIKTPIPLVNHLLQGEPEQAGTDLMRFGINTTAGMLGLFDVAQSRFDLPRRDSGFSETLIHYGTDYGAYMVLPLMGPSNVRDGSAFIVDGFLNPLTFILNIPEGIVVRGFDHFQHYAPSADLYLDIKEESEDPYIFFRNMHLQGLQRDAEFPKND